jgi:hypothetical protein
LTIGCGSNRLVRPSEARDGGVGEAGLSAVDEAASSETAASGTDVAGTVVSFYELRPLMNRTVTIGGRTTITGADGRFAMSGVLGTYDVAVIDPDGIGISIYKGITRRDPLLPHRGIPIDSRSAKLTGAVSGGGNYPVSGKDAVTISFFSEQADASWTLSEQLSSLLVGPGYGPIRLAWNGPASISGKLAAFGTFYDVDGGASQWFVARAQTISDGQAPYQNVALTQLTQTRHVSGTIDLPNTSQVLSKEIFYRLPILHARIAMPFSQLSALDDDVPDLGYPGAELCVGITATPGSMLTEQCGIAAGQTTVTVTVQPPPTLSSPADGASVTRTTEFSWSAFDGGIYMLQLSGNPEGAGMPRMDVFTHDVRTGWPDLSGVGVSFPGGANYLCSVGGLGPYASMDDALGPAGVAAPFPAETRKSYSGTIHLTTMP